MSPVRPGEPGRNADGATLVVEGLTRQFGNGGPAVNDLAFALGAGQVLCLAGPSGSGKSTLLRLLAGVEVPDAGTIRLDGRELAGPSAFVEPDQRGIGFMFQDYALFPHLSVAQNVGFGLAALPRAARARRVAEMLDRIGIAHLAERAPHSLSGGEQQRVALARALAPRPVVLLMDEPFSNLDRALRARLRDETMAQLRAQGTAAIIVTHDSDEALSTGDRLAVMRDGRIVQQGPARQVYAAPASAFVADLLSTCAHLPGWVEAGEIRSAVGPLPLPRSWPGGTAAQVLLRPEALTLLPAGQPGTPALVDSVAFLGAQDAVRLRVRQLVQPLTVFAPPGLAQPGAAMTLRVDPARALVFPAAEND